MHTIHAVALAVSIMAAVPAYAGGLHSLFCFGEAEITVKVQAFQRENSSAELQILEGEDAAAWAQSYNTMRPASNFKIDKIWVISDPKVNANEFLVAFFSKNQTCTNTSMPVEMYNAIVEHAKTYRN